MYCNHIWKANLVINLHSFIPSESFQKLFSSRKFPYVYYTECKLLQYLFKLWYRTEVGKNVCICLILWMLISLLISFTGGAFPVLYLIPNILAYLLQSLQFLLSSTERQYILNKTFLTLI